MDVSYGDLLDYLASTKSVTREIYGFDKEQKPNDHCVWQEIGFTRLVYAWVETDEHLKGRVLNEI